MADVTDKTMSTDNTLNGLPGIYPYMEKKGEQYMNENQRIHFKNILHAMRREVMEEVDRTVNTLRDDDKNLPDAVDRATREEEIRIMLRTRDREGKLLKKIEEALDRIERKEFGYCESCGIEIGIKRLEARPTATQCIDCKTLDEIREKQLGG